MLAQMISAGITTVFAWAMIELAGYQLAYGQRLGVWLCRTLGLALASISFWMWGVAL